MIQSGHKIGSNAWYDDLEADMIRRGIPAFDGNISKETTRLMWENKIYIPPDRRYTEKVLREDGTIPESMSMEEWVESMMPEMKRLYPDLFPPEKEG